MARFIPLLVVAATSIPSAWAGDRPLLALQTGLPAPPPIGSWLGSAGRPDLTRWGVFEGGCLDGRIGSGLSDPNSRGGSTKAVGDARDVSDARLARYLIALASARARDGDLRGAADLQEFAIHFCDDEQIRGEIQRSVAIYRDEQRRGRRHFQFIRATIDGLPLRR